MSGDWGGHFLLLRWEVLLVGGEAARLRIGGPGLRTVCFPGMRQQVYYRLCRLGQHFCRDHKTRATVPLMPGRIIEDKGLKLLEKAQEKEN